MLWNSFLNALMLATLSLWLSSGSYGESSADYRGVKMAEQNATPIPPPWVWPLILNRVERQTPPVRRADEPAESEQEFDARMQRAREAEETRRKLFSREAQGGLVSMPGYYQQGGADDDDDVPLPRERPLNMNLPEDDPGNQRVLRANRLRAGLPEDYEGDYHGGQEEKYQPTVPPPPASIEDPALQQQQRELEIEIRRRLQEGSSGPSGYRERYANEPVPLPRPRPYNPNLPQNEPGNQRALRTMIQTSPIMRAFENWGKTQQEEQERRPRYETEQERELQRQEQWRKEYLERQQRERGGLIDLPGRYAQGGLGLPQMNTAGMQAHFGALNALRAARLPGPRLSAVRAGVRAPARAYRHSTSSPDSSPCERTRDAA
jgi:hypothetical protein